MLKFVLQVLLPKPILHSHGDAVRHTILYSMINDALKILYPKHASWVNRD